MQEPSGLKAPAGPHASILVLLVGLGVFSLLRVLNQIIGDSDNTDIQSGGTDQ